jgi:hypothetical protein|tara:strand:+ start:418 stop:1536 length:1119 start_codon:yes stop_codon:yes gene_type:complete
MTISNNKLLMAAAGASSDPIYLLIHASTGIEVMDVTDANNPSREATIYHDDNLDGISSTYLDINNNRLYVNDYSENKLQIWNITDILNASFVASHAVNDGGSYPSVTQGNGITKDGDYIIMGNTNEITRIDVSNENSISNGTPRNVSSPGYGGEYTIMIGGNDTDSSGQTFGWLIEDSLIRIFRYDQANISQKGYRDDTGRLAGAHYFRNRAFHDSANNLLLTLAANDASSPISSWSYSHADMNSSVPSFAYGTGPSYLTVWDVDIENRRLVTAKDGILYHFTYATNGSFSEQGNITNSSLFDSAPKGIAIDADRDIAFVVRRQSNSDCKLFTVDISNSSSLSVTNTYDLTGDSITNVLSCEMFKQAFDPDA